MQSSYKIIKSTIVGKDTVISSPVIEKLYKQYISKDSSQISFEDIQKSIVKEAVEEKIRIINEAQNKAHEIINKAKNTAEDILEKAKDEGFQEGYRNGYSEGYQYGLNEAREQCTSMKEDAEAFIKSCHEESRKYIKKCEKEIIKLAVEIARHILKSELSINPDAVYKIAEGIISKAVDKKQVILKVSPLDFNTVKNRKEELSIYVEDSSSIIVVADPSIEQGSLKAETPSGFIDGSIDTQLDIILKNLSGD